VLPPAEFFLLLAGLAGSRELLFEGVAGRLSDLLGNFILLAELIGIASRLVLDLRPAVSDAALTLSATDVLLPLPALPATDRTLPVLPVDRLAGPSGLLPVGSTLRRPDLTLAD